LYPQFAEELFGETGVDIELDRTGTLSLAFSDVETEELRAKYDWQRAAGIAVESLDQDQIRGLEPAISEKVRAGYRYPSDWQVENRKLVSALRKYCENNGIELIENSPVGELLIENGVAKGARAKAADLLADSVVVTAGAWSSNILPKPDVKPIRGQMISLAGGGSSILRHVIYSPRGYVVPRADGRILVGATVEDVGFNKEVTPGAITSLKAAAVEIAPILAGLTVSEAWAGLRPFAEGEMPVIGRVPQFENAFIATGHYRNGILLAPITARMIADAILGAKSGVPVSASFGANS
jgi:glycine oxidase